jgi:hypothetical protein
MAVGARVDLSKWPTRVVTTEAMRAIGQAVATQMAQRTFREGRGLSDRPHAAYSTDRVVVYFRSEIARRLKPKGGAPWHARRGPQRGVDGRRGAIIGREYAGGYSEYKRASRKGVGSGGVLVDLTASGQLARSLDVTAVLRTRCVVTVRGAAVTYAEGVNSKRPWFGLSPKDRGQVDQTIGELLTAVLEGQRR